MNTRAAIDALLTGSRLRHWLPPVSVWEAEAGSLTAETTRLIGRRLSALLVAGSAGQRSRAWPTLRTELVVVTARWSVLHHQAVGYDRQAHSARICGLLAHLLAAVDAENQAMVSHEDWTVLRPRLRRAQRLLAATLQAPSTP
jgi:hypothetical protein